MKPITTYPLRLPHSIKAAVVRLAKEDGTSINQFVVTAVAEKIAALETDSFLLSGDSELISLRSENLCTAKVVNLRDGETKFHHQSEKQKKWRRGRPFDSGAMLSLAFRSCIAPEPISLPRK